MKSAYKNPVQYLTLFFRFKDKELHKRIYGFIYKSDFIFLLIAPILSMNILAADLNQVDYNGMQLAFVFLPRTPASEEGKDLPKPKTNPKSNQSPAIKPAEAPAPKLIEAPSPKPIPTAVAEPVLQQPAASKPAPAPLVKPASIPETKPAQLAVVKPEQHPATKETQALEWVIGLGYDFGGEELGKIYYTDGSSASVKANNGIAINVGAILANGNSAFSTQMTLGYKYGGQTGANGDVIWSAIPLELIEYYRLSNIRMGLGLSYQLRPQLSVNLPSGYNDKYNNAIGLIAQFGWAPTAAHYSIDLRYTSVKFQLSDVQGAPTVDGSVTGLYTSYRF